VIRPAASHPGWPALLAAALLYYGSQSAWAAHLAARVWTITATAERNGHEPLAYLTEYLNACAAAGGKAPEGPTLDRFLPWIPDPSHTTGSRDNDPPTINQPHPGAPSGPSP
jgi:transposase